MDVQQLKLLAGRVRGLLEQYGTSLSHGQSLDLVAALAGLRNWPEVMAFPDRVAACGVDDVAVASLARRLQRQCGLVIGADVVAGALQAAAGVPARATQVWPGGPAPGVYVTDSQAAINALLAHYEEATDGALVYAERAGDHADGSIDLGESGLWSRGLDRVPSGTLLVVGPLEMTQQSWSESASRLEMACQRASSSGHRVAVLVDTPTPETMCNDLDLMARSCEPGAANTGAVLAGVVTDDGELQRRMPFARPLAPPPTTPSPATLEAVPATLLPALKRALAGRSTGLVVLGATARNDHPAIDLVAATLALTEHAGPVARIKPRNRSTPAKDMMVPDAVKALPFLPSIESAYAQGYRRLIVESGYTRTELLHDYGDRVLFITGVYGLDVGDVFLNVCRSGGFDRLCELLAQVVAVVGVGQIEAKGGMVQVSDLYLPIAGDLAADGDFKMVLDHMLRHRALRWEDELDELLAAKRVSVASVKKSFPRAFAVNDFLAARASRRPGMVG